MKTLRSLLQPTILFFLFLLLLPSATTLAQQTRKSTPTLNYGFVSPNTRGDLKLEDALRGMNSAEEWDLARKSRALRCVVKRPVMTSRAVGSWSDGAEHSVLLRVKADEPTIRYLMSKLGQEFDQKAVVYFHPDSNGSARIYVLYPTPRFLVLPSLARTLDQAGIVFRTLVPSKRGTAIYVIDTENNMAAKIKTAAKRLRARTISQRGNASFIGDDSIREKGQEVFSQEIKDYETNHPGLPPPCTNN